MSRFWAWLGSTARRLIKDRDDDDNDDGMRIAINLDDSFDKPDDGNPKS